VVNAAGSSVLFTLHDETSSAQLRTTIERVLATGRPVVTPIVEDSRGVLGFGLIHPIFASKTDSAAGATALGDALAELEAAAKRHDLEAIDRYYEEFQRLRPLVMESLDLLVPVR
jgi:hypothetical protein